MKDRWMMHKWKAHLEDCLALVLVQPDHPHCAVFQYLERNAVRSEVGERDMMFWRNEGVSQ